MTDEELKNLEAQASLAAGEIGAMVISANKLLQLIHEVQDLRGYFKGVQKKAAELAITAGVKVRDI